MRVTDLMVGDWVNVNGLNFKVGAIHADEIGVVDPDYKIYWCSDDEFDRIDPIPLTEEILVKNGFHKVPPHQLGRHTTYDLFKFKTNFMLTRKDEGNIIYDRNITVTYVHQLQHLLRLCGIEKEIEL